MVVSYQSNVLGRPVNPLGPRPKPTSKLVRDRRHFGGEFRDGQVLFGSNRERG